MLTPNPYVTSALPAPGVALGFQSPQQNTRVSWQEHLPKPSQGWDNEQAWNDEKGWDSEAKEDNMSSWGSGDPWDEQKQGSTLSATRHDRVQEQNSQAWDLPVRSRRTSGASQSVHVAPLSMSSEFHTARTQPHVPGSESGVDEEGWTHVNAGPDSTAEWKMTQSVHPRDSISRMGAPSTTTASLKDDTLTERPLGSRLQSLKNAEHKRRIEVAPPPNKYGVPEHPRSISHMVYGFSTFERSIRGKMSSGGRYKKSKTEDRDIQKLWDDASPSEMVQSQRGDDAVRETKSQSGAWRGSSPVAVEVNGWTDEQFNGPASAVPSASPNDHKSVKRTSWGAPSEPQDDPIVVDSWQADVNGWGTTPEAKSSADEPNPWGAYPGSKKQPSDSQKVKHHQARVMETDVTPARDVPPPAPAQKSISEYGKPEREAEPILKISKEDAAKKGIDHQVRAGKGSKYGHAIGRPEYVDSLDKPVSSIHPRKLPQILKLIQYAVFRFKYRSHATLRKLLGNDVVPSDPSRLTVLPVDQLALTKSKDDPEDIKKLLKNLPKDTLIKGLLDMQSELDKAKGEAMQVAQTEVEGMKRTKDWVRGQSREVSERNKKSEDKGEDWYEGAKWETKVEW